MVTRLRLITALGALVMAVVVVWQQTPPVGTRSNANVQLRSTGAPISGPVTTSSPAVKLTNPRPFDACEDIPDSVIAELGLAFTPPKPTESMRCEYDAGNYQMAVQAFIWRSYDETLPADALETTINGHRAAQYWVMKPTEWNNRWWFSCMVTFKTSYGVIQQSLYYSPVYSNPDVDCPSENLMRAQQLSPHYIF
ncbi:MAG: DUF3558 family protein [Mycobacterium sp.]